MEVCWEGAGAAEGTSALGAAAGDSCVEGAGWLTAPRMKEAYANASQAAFCSCKIINRGNCSKTISNFWSLKAIPLASYR